MTVGLWFGCKPGIPADIIRPDKMEKVLYDIHVADGYISTIPTVDSAKKVGAAYYNGIYKKFEIDSAIYSKSMDYYYDHPEKLSVIYKSIGTTIKSQIRNIQKSDSLKNDKIIQIQILHTERVTDSALINLPYDIDRAKRSLYLERYNDIYSKRAIIFDFLKIKKEKLDSIKSEKRVKLASDSLVLDKKLALKKLKLAKDSLVAEKKKRKLKKIKLPVEAMPLKRK